jgi:hypothetical protein
VKTESSITEGKEISMKDMLEQFDKMVKKGHSNWKP